uniref:hypothetical protein n=1 Tax=Modestobacter sp. KNN46-3 TaxID=2711218 RepID=UPI0013E09FE4
MTQGKSSEPKPTPVLTFSTEEQTQAAEAIIAALAEVLKSARQDMPGANAKMLQFLNGLINPAATSIAFVDHTGKRRAVTTFASRVAAERRAAFLALADDEHLSREQIGDLVG